MEEAIGESSFGECETVKVCDSIEKAVKEAEDRDHRYDPSRVLELKASERYEDVWYVVHNYELRGEQHTSHSYRIRKMALNKSWSWRSLSN